jgi:hypothetical protein
MESQTDRILELWRGWGHRADDVPETRRLHGLLVEICSRVPRGENGRGLMDEIEECLLELETMGASPGSDR